MDNPAPNNVDISLVENQDNEVSIFSYLMPCVFYVFICKVFCLNLYGFSSSFSIKR